MGLKTKFLTRNAIPRGHGIILAFSILLLAVPVQSRAEEGVRIPGDLCSWQTMSWLDLNAAEKLAWSGLGWTMQTWDNPDPATYPASYRKSWPELVYTEKLLARKLGYSRKTWDAEGCPNHSTRAHRKPDASGQAGRNGSID